MRTVCLSTYIGWLSDLRPSPILTSAGGASVFLFGCKRGFLFGLTSLSSPVVCCAIHVYGALSGINMCTIHKTDKRISHSDLDEFTRLTSIFMAGVCRHHIKINESFSALASRLRCLEMHY